MADRGQIPDAVRLERRYRRLMACYPAWYRRVHEGEMLAVLMTGAPPQKRWPAVAEVADLLWGALRIRCQPSRGGEAEPAWRDALAVLSVIVPMSVLEIGVVNTARALMSLPQASVQPSLGQFLVVNTARVLVSLPPPGPSGQAPPMGILTGLAPALTMAALVLLALRWRRIAALAAAALLVWLVSHLPSLGVAFAARDAYLVLAAGLQLAALAVSPGPRRGLQLLTWKHGLVVVIAAVLAGTAVIPLNLPARLAVIAVICLGMAVASSLGRWLLVWLAVPAYPFLAAYYSPFGRPPGFRIVSAFLPGSAAFVVPYYLPPLALLVVAVVAARRSSFIKRRRSVPDRA